MDNKNNIQSTLNIIEECSNIQPPSPIHLPLAEQPDFKREIKQLIKANSEARKSITVKKSNPHPPNSDPLIVTAIKSILGK